MRSDFSLVKHCERHFTKNLFYFVEKFPAGDARKAAIAELKLKAEQRKSAFPFIYYIFSLY